MTQVDTNELKSIALRNYNKIPSLRGDDISSYFRVALIWLAEWVAEKQSRSYVEPGYRDTACVVVSELKVLRHCHFPEEHKRNKKCEAAKTKKERDAALKPLPVSAEFNEKWALRGALQAARYKDTKAAESAALVLYDMRDGDADIPAVHAQCNADCVKYVRYYLHNNLLDEG